MQHSVGGIGLAPGRVFLGAGRGTMVLTDIPGTFFEQVAHQPSPRFLNTSHQKAPLAWRQGRSSRLPNRRAGRIRDDRQASGMIVEPSSRPEIDGKRRIVN